MKMKLYLCGPILGCKNTECIDWRNKAAKVLSFYSILDPMRRDYRNSHGEHIDEIVEVDKTDIDSCSAMLVKFDRPSVGTNMEILYGWERSKFIVTVVENPLIVLSPWLKYHSTFIVRSFDVAYGILNLFSICVNEIEKENAIQITDGTIPHYKYMIRSMLPHIETL